MWENISEKIGFQLKFESISMHFKSSLYKFVCFSGNKIVYISPNYF